MSRVIRHAVIVAAIATAAVVLSPAAQAYLKLGSSNGNTIVGINWLGRTISYRVTNRDASGVTASQLQEAIAQGFEEWARPEHVELSTQFAGFTTLEPDIRDGQNVLGFQSRPDLDRTLGSTSFQTSATTGALISADIFLNTSFQWSVASGGQTGRFDVLSIMTHEIGHLLGLGHSALGETQSSGGGRSVTGKRAVMFPIAYGPGSIEDRTIEADDVAGITDIYGDSSADNDLGSIGGRVTLNGAGVFGAHITAVNISTGEMVSGFSLSNAGDFAIAAMKPGVYLVRAEPLDDADIDGFFDDDAPVNLNFRVTYFTKQVAVPKGGSSGSIEIKVRAK
jgi:hypothetical protein